MMFATQVRPQFQSILHDLVMYFFIALTGSAAITSCVHNPKGNLKSPVTFLNGDNFQTGGNIMGAPYIGRKESEPSAPLEIADKKMNHIPHFHF